jgi:tetratricopeptide (TPR) repeat protein
MTRHLLPLLLLVAAAPAEEGQLARFRLRKDPLATMSGWVVSHDNDGFVLETLARDRRLTVKWADLVEEDARKLRVGYGLDLTEEQEKGIIDGHELQLEGGGSVRGLLHSIDKDGAYWMRVRGNLLPYPKDRVARLDAGKIGEDEAYGEEEVYARRLSRRPPKTAEEHRRLADYLYDVGNFDAARQHYEEALSLDPKLEALVAARIGASREYLEDRAAAEAFGKAKADAYLNGRWREAIETVRAYLAAHPEVLRRGERLIGELEDNWFAAKRARFHAVKHEEFDRLVRSQLARKKPSLEEAMAWATTDLPLLLMERTARRLGLEGEEAEALAGTQAPGSPHWASYWSGTFAISKRASTGQSTKREIRGDPEGWWRQYDDVNTRAAWIKAYTAERVGLFEVVQVTTTPCERCGGTGQVTKWAPRGLANGRSEWQERCPRCFGACDDRGVGYR